MFRLGPFVRPHAPYDPPEPERTRFQRAPYDGEITYADRQIGKLLDGYRELGRLDRTMIVLTADHGESLGQHSEATHGVFVYDTTLRVPLVIVAPNTARGQRFTHQVRLIDLLPTIAEVVGLEIPEGVEGVDLAPLLRGETSSSADVPAYLESMYPRESYGWSDFRGLRSNDWKLIVGTSPELYDLRADPDERHDLAASEPSRLQAMLDEMLSLHQAETGLGTPHRLELDAQTRERLAALGYTWNDPNEPSDGSSGPVDPRVRLAELEATLNRVDAWLAADQTVEAERELRGLLHTNPENPKLLDYLAAVVARQHRYAEVVAICDKLVRLTPWDVQVWMRYGLALEQAARPRDALEAFAAAVQLDPWHSEAWLQYSTLLVATNRPDEALDALDASQQRGHVGLEFLLLRAKALAQIGAIAKIESTLSAAQEQLGANPANFAPTLPEGSSDTPFRLRNAQLAGEIAAVCWQEERYDLAAHGYRIAASPVPDDARIQFNLGLSLERLRQYPQAIEAHRRALALDPAFEAANRHLAALLARGAP